MLFPRIPLELVIEQLAAEHEIESFRCSEKDLNRYLNRFARVSQVEGYSKTYVAVEPGQKVVRAFYTLYAGCVEKAMFPGAPKPPPLVPVIYLGRMAVDVALEGNGIGTWLLADAFDVSLRIADLLGFHALLMEAKNTDLRDGFYSKRGFVPFNDNDARIIMYQSLDKLRTARARSLGQG